MKHLLLLLLFCVQLQDVDIREALKKDPTCASLNTRNYEFYPDAVMTPAPKGYKAFYISQYARHGARTNTGVNSQERIIKYLDAARAEGLLTPAADTVYAEACAVRDLTIGHEGVLVHSGQLEHEMLAKRLYDRYGSVFKYGAKHHQSVRVKCTTSHRVLLSMAAFTNSLTSEVPGLEYVMSAAPIDGDIISNGPDDRLRAGTKAIAQKVMDNYSDADCEYLMKRLFTDPSKAASICKAQKLEQAIYNTARFSKPLERSVDLYSFLSEEALYRYWLYYATELYLYNGNSVEFGAQRMPRCQKLVDIIFDNAEDAISSGTVCADLFFGHDYPILALASRLGVSGVGERLCADQVASRWTDPSNISFASNLQLVFFRNRAGDILVKVIYNDRERHLVGLEAVNGCYYRWDDIKSLR